ncbi:hypothetical protein F4781DRAFT_314882 [Annulohypoxylon bovei var. microspora]|nr:hypothetical protein F4781DRAFT_314882 [Annulohypoxylon bovei var. microspora]
MPTHMFEYIIKTSPSGRNLHHHHHHEHRYRSHPRCSDTCAGVSVEKWNGLVEQNQDLTSSNETLTREAQSLKAELQTAVQENARLSTSNQHLVDEVSSLRRSRSVDSETAAGFRRRIAALNKEVDGKDAEIESLKKKKGYLATRVDVLSETVKSESHAVADLTKRLLDWQAQAALLRDAYKRYKCLFHASERDLKDSKALVKEQQRMLRHWENPLSPRGRRYSCI